MSDWYTRINKDRHDTFPCTQHFRIVHDATGGHLAVRHGSMKDGADIQIYPHHLSASGQDDLRDMPAAAEWRFEPVDYGKGIGVNGIGRLLLVNRRSGLPLRTRYRPRGDHFLFQSAFDWETFSHEEEPFYYLNEGRRNADGQMRYDISVNPAHGRVYLNCDRTGMLGDTVPVIFSTEPVSAFRLVPSVSPVGAKADASRAYELHLDEVGSGYAYAHEALGMLSGIAGTMGNIGNTFAGVRGEVGAAATVLGASAYLVSGTLDIFDHVVSFFEISDNANRENPLQTLYKNMMPEIEQIMKDELVQDSVSDAMGEAKAASIAWRTTARAIAAYSAKCREDGVEDGVWVFEHMDPRQRDRIGNLLSQSDEHFRSALAVLMRPRNAEAGFSAFTPIAIEHTAVVMLLAMLYPEVDGTNVGGVLGAYKAHAERQFATLRDRRLRQIGRDRERESAPYFDKRLEVPTYFADRAWYEHHLTRTLDADLGNPRQAIRDWGRIIQPA